MKLIHKRKSTTGKSLKQTLNNVKMGETWVYGTGKLKGVSYHEIGQLSAHMIKDLANKDLSDYFIYRKYIKRDLQFSSTPAMLTGTAFHTAVLEPKDYDSTYAVSPKFDRRTKEGKAGYAIWSAQNDHKTLLTDEQDTQVKNMTSAVKSNKYATAILDGCHSEVSGFILLESDRILKGRIDSINYASNYGVDLKSVEDCSPKGFASAVAKYRYDIQAYTYKKLFGLDEFLFLCCSKKDPYEIGIYDLNNDFMAKSEDDFELAMERWERILVSGEHNTFANKNNPMITLAPPNWFNYL